MRYAWVGLLVVGCAASTPVTCDFGDGTGQRSYACRDQSESFAAIGAACSGPNRIVVCIDGETYCQVNPAVVMDGAMTAEHAYRCDDAGHITVE